MIAEPSLSGRPESCLDTKYLSIERWSNARLEGDLSERQGAIRGSAATVSPDAPATKSITVSIRSGMLQWEEDGHELGWDVDPIAERLEGIGIHLRRVRVFPCECEPCRRP